MVAIVCVLLVIQICSMFAFACALFWMLKLRDEMLEVSQVAPSVNLDPIHDEIKRFDDRLNEMGKMVETMRSAIVLKSSFTK